MRKWSSLTRTQATQVQRLDLQATCLTTRPGPQGCVQEKGRLAFPYTGHTLAPKWSGFRLSTGLFPEALSPHLAELHVLPWGGNLQSDGLKPLQLSGSHQAGAGSGGQACTLAAPLVPLETWQRAERHDMSRVVPSLW